MESPESTPANSLAHSTPQPEGAGRPPVTPPSSTISPAKKYLLITLVVIVVLILVGAVSGVYLGAKVAAGKKFKILGPSTLTAGQPATITWDTNPENAKQYPFQKIEYCAGKLTKKKCYLLAAAVKNNGKATINISASLPTGKGILQFTARDPQKKLFGSLTVTSSAVTVKPASVASSNNGGDGGSGGGGGGGDGGGGGSGGNSQPASTENPAPAVAAHISYFESGYNLENLKYITNASGSWVSARVDEGGYVGDGSSLVVDSQKKIHISYHYSPIDHDLKYATNASGSWVTSTIDSGAVGQQTAIAIDGNDKAHIVYRDDTARAAKYATNASGSWVTSLMTGVGDCYSVVIDAAGKAHAACVTYSTATDKQVIQYVTNASGSWVATEVDSPNSGGGYYYPFPSLKIDAQNKAHLSYLFPTTSTPNRQLKYATNASGAWVKTVVDSTVDFTDWPGHTTSLGLDGAGKAHISYLDRSPTALRYATNASGTWATTTVDADGAVGYFNDLAIDNSGRVHISYFDNMNNRLKYATNASGSWVTAVAETGESVGSFSSIGVSW